MEEKNNLQAYFLYPERGMISVIKIPGARRKDGYSFAMIEMELNDDDSDIFNELQSIFRHCKAIAIAQMPSSGSDEDVESTIVLSFHLSKDNIEELESSMLMLSLPFNINDDRSVLDAFNEKLETDGHFCLSILMRRQILFLGIVELFAMAPPYSDENFEGVLAMYLGTVKYYGEYQPPLESPVDGILFPLENYRAKILPTNEGAINMTGLIPEGLA